MNYYNYFTEIEDEFVKRRGRHILISPLDWSLIETWQQRGIPLHVVLRGVNASFDAYEQREARARRVNSLFYCQQEVEAQFQAWTQSRVGAAHQAEADGSAETATAQSDDQFSPAAITAYLSERQADLERLRESHGADPVLAPIIERAVDRIGSLLDDLRTSGQVSPEQIEGDLARIEEMIVTGLRESAGEERLARLTMEAQTKLKSYRDRMERGVFEQTIRNFIARRLREEYRVPRLGLFYR
jgi:hypothetical protein